MLEIKEEKLAVNNIEKHNFEAAKKSLQNFANEHHEVTDLMTVPSEGGLFGWFDHKVTGDELNDLTAQIQDHLIRINNIHQGVLTEIVQVYKALDALDKDYISAIVSSIKATEEVNRKAIKNQQDIQDSVVNQEKTIEVLKSFKAKFDNIEHLADIDNIWKTLNEHKQELISLNNFNDRISKIEHIDDVDKIWTHQEETDNQFIKLNEILNNTGETIKEAKKSINNLTAFKEKIENICNVDSLFEDVSKIETDILNHKQSIEALHSELSAEQYRIEILKNQIDQRIYAIEQNANEHIKSLKDKLVKENELLSLRCKNIGNKLKYAFLISGCAATFVVVHFVLDLMGVL